MKLIVLSDLHLTAPGDEAHGLDTHARFAAAIERINADYADADLVAVAGDLADRGKAEAYEALRQGLDRLSVPWAVTIGNHDNRPVFAEVFGAEHLDENGFVQSAHDLDGHSVLLLDSAAPGPSPSGNWGRWGGELCEARLHWTAGQLARAKDRPVIVALHHPPVQVGIVMDHSCLDGPGALHGLLQAHGDVRQVLSGHIHMNCTTTRGGIAYTTIAGGHSTSREAFGTRDPDRKSHATGPAVMATVLSDAEQTTVHFDPYIDGHQVIS